MSIETIVKKCNEMPIPMGQVRNELCEHVKEETPFVITTWGSESAYVIPASLLKELMK